MKKAVIKRRKRVVPALRDQSPTAATQSSTGSSASPEASPAAFAYTHDNPAQYHYPGDQQNPFAPNISPHNQPLYPQSQRQAPPPADFTGYGSHLVSLPHHPAPGSRVEGDQATPSTGARSLHSVELNNPKKRTIADTGINEGPPGSSEVPISTHLPPINPSGPTSASNQGRLSSISSLLNHANALSEESRLDPSLNSIPRAQQPQYSTRSFSPSNHSTSPSPAPLSTSSQQDSYKAERRAQLQREAENMREALRAKERELASFD